MKNNRSVCSFCEGKLHTRVKTVKEVNYKHTSTINHIMCYTDHPQAVNEHR